MIALWGLHADGPLSRVYTELRRQQAQVVFIDQRRVLDYGITLDAGAGVSGLLRLDDALIDLADITAAYVRPYDYWRIGAVARAGLDSPESRHAAAFDDTLWAWAQITAARVVNRPSAMSSNGSKPRQALTIAEHGFAVPATLITTDGDAVREYQQQHGALVYKSISGTRSIVSSVTTEHDERLADLAWCPTQFQQQVPGVDYRVHVVGDGVFCARVESTADDYRYGALQGADVDIRPATLPLEVQQRCLGLARALDFLLAGIDLRLTPDGEWYCFEVNPSPAFTFYDRHGQGIAGAVAALLLETGRQP